MRIGIIEIKAEHEFVTFSTSSAEGRIFLPLAFAHSQMVEKSASLAVMPRPRFVVTSRFTSLSATLEFILKIVCRETSERIRLVLHSRTFGSLMI